MKSFNWTAKASNVESKFPPSAVAMQELVDSMKELYRTEKGYDVIITAPYGDIEYKFKAHTAIICPRSRIFMELLESDNKNGSDDRLHNWCIDEWNPNPPGWQPSVVDEMLQYLYKLDYQDETNECPGPFPEISNHADLWCIGFSLGIKGLKAMAADRFKLALSQCNVYGSEVGFNILYFQRLVQDIEHVWDNTQDYMEDLRSQISTHIHHNITDWAKKEGSQSRFLESTYRLIFREIGQDNQDFKALLGTIKAKYLRYLDTECGYEASGNDREALISNDM